MRQEMQTLAARLWQARGNGTVVCPATITEPADEAEAYAVQNEIVRLSGEPSIGFKVGSTSPEAQAFLGTTEPASCPILSRYSFAAPASITLVTDHMPALEGEFAFRLACDLPPRDAAYTEAEVREAIGAVAGAIEVVGTRLEGGLAGKGRLLVTADSGANMALVVGPWTTEWQHIDLAAHPAAMIVNGSTVSEGTGARALGNPMNVMVWLANQQSQRGRGLKARDIISTGTCTGLDPVAPGDQVKATFGSLGDVAVSFG